MRASQRITTLDALRGFAVLGILAMNAVSFGLVSGAYWNISGGGNDSWVDWAIGGAGEIFIDQKFMALFSMLFGAGFALFFERGVARGARAGWLGFWRNSLLLGIGLLHALLWEGDILRLYAICFVFLIALHRLRPGYLYAIGGLAILASAGLAVAVQTTVTEGSTLGEFWLSDAQLAQASPDDWLPDSMAAGRVVGWVVLDAFLRALGMMLIGIGLYRTGVITGMRSPRFYRRAAAWGLGIGLPLSAAGFTWVAVADFSPDVAIVGSVPNTLATYPIAFGYLGLIALWNQSPASALHRRVHAVGRMALTNYLAQTVIGVIVLQSLLDSAQLNRGWLAVFMLAVWALQLAWSGAWLARFRFGPIEWLWRCATYRRWQSFR